MRDELMVMNGPGNQIDPLKLNDFEAGVFFLGSVDKMKPGITFGELMSIGEQTSMSGFDLFRMTGNLLGDAKDLIGEVARGTGSMVGSTVRLLTDEQVINGLTKGAAAYSSGGASGGIQGMIEKFGSVFKGVAGGGSGGVGNRPDGAGFDWSMNNPIVWGIGIGGSALIYLLLRAGSR